jgi:hypothetical protein
VKIEELLIYLSSVIESRPGTERWSSWWARHRHAARLLLSADEFKALEAGPAGIWKVARAHGLEAKPCFLPLAREPMEIPSGVYH